jgi:hypothetical protein
MKVIRDRCFCEICGTNYLGNNQRHEVHHWTYANVPKEKMEDVSLLCARCHSQAHLVIDGYDPGDVIRQFVIHTDGGMKIVSKKIDKDYFIQSVEFMHKYANGYEY